MEGETEAVKLEMASLGGPMTPTQSVQASTRIVEAHAGIIFVASGHSQLRTMARDNRDQSQPTRLQAGILAPLYQNIACTTEVALG